MQVRHIKAEEMSPMIENAIYKKTTGWSDLTYNLFEAHLKRERDPLQHVGYRRHAAWSIHLSFLDALTWLQLTSLLE